MNDRKKKNGDIASAPADAGNTPPRPAPAADGEPSFMSRDLPEPPAAADGERLLDRELHSIYDENGPVKPDMTRLDQANHSTLKKVLIGFVFFFAFLAAVSWAGFFFFAPGDKKFSGEGVEVTVDGPPQIKSGETVVYTVNYKNGEKIPLGTASLQVRLPKELVPVKAEPSPDDNEQYSWQIGSLAPGKGGSVTITGVATAPVGKQLDLQAILTYRPADFNSEFQKVSTRAIGVADSVLQLGATGPAKVMPGDQVALDLSYVNTSDNEFKGVSFRAVYPAGFIPDTVDPPAVDADKTEWNIDSIPAGVENHVKINGSFASDAKGPMDFKSQIGFVDQNGNFELQKENVFSTEVIEGQLVVNLILNGKTGDQPVNFGDTLHYSITYRNTGSAVLEDAALTVELDSQPDPARVILWDKLDDKQQGLRDNNRLTWAKEQVSSLGRIGPQEEGTIDFDVPVLAAPLADAASTDYRVTSWVEASVAKIDGDEVDRKSQTPPFSAVFLSDSKLTSEARYFNADGIPIGTGPLPPVAGQATTYRVYWELTNALHELSDLKISAHLPDNASWTGKSDVDAGDLKFDAANSKIIWTLNWLPLSIKDLKIDFDVALTPTPDQVDKTPTLVDATILEATDKATGGSIILSMPPLTTELEADDMAAGKGKVKGQ